MLQIPLEFELWLIIETVFFGTKQEQIPPLHRLEPWQIHLQGMGKWFALLAISQDTLEWSVPKDLQVLGDLLLKRNRLWILEFRDPFKRVTLIDVLVLVPIVLILVPQMRHPLVGVHCLGGMGSNLDHR